MEVLEFLRAIRRGAVIADLGQALTGATNQVQQTLKPATVSLTVTIEPMGNGKVKVAAVVGSKLPKVETEKTLFFIDEDGSLTRQMPGQPSLGITEGIDR